MEASRTSREQAEEKSAHTQAREGNSKADNPLARAFFADQRFVEATRKGMKAAEAGETGVLLEDLRRQVSESG